MSANIKTIKICGMEEVINKICGDQGDSYATYIEDPKTAETAQHAFYVGPEDMKKVVEEINGENHSPVRSMITIWFEINTPELVRMISKIYRIPRIGNMLMCTYDYLREIRGMRINEATIGNIGDILELNKWIQTLPYQELLEI